MPFYTEKALITVCLIFLNLREPLFWRNEIYIFREIRQIHRRNVYEEICVRLKDGVAIQLCY